MRTCTAITLALVCAASPGFAADFAFAPTTHESKASTPTSKVDEYVIDDGTGEGNVGRSNGGTQIWVNQFNALAGAEVITSIRIAGGLVPEGTPLVILIFDDPNNDGDPSDVTPSDVLYVAAGTTGPSDSDAFVDYPVPDANVGIAGSSFFVGACISHDSDQNPARSDQTVPNGQSWLAGDDMQGADCTDPNALAFPFFNVDTVSVISGNWMIRASAKGGAIAGAARTWGTVKDAYK